MNSFSLHQGSTPLLISMPHNGTEIPNDIARGMTEGAKKVPDTDWFLDRLYDFALPLGASVLNPRFSRYVIDLNRAPDGKALYAGANNTELCPTTSFSEAPVYLPGMAPNEEQIEQRILSYWRPYHEAIQSELTRIKAQHGYAILFEAHSIQSQVPRFFQGRLPDINFGTADGASASSALVEILTNTDFSPYSHVFNGRFKGGYITRHYGRPNEDIHAIQLELSQMTYMDEATLSWDEAKAQRIAPVLKNIIETILGLSKAQLLKP